MRFILNEAEKIICAVIFLGMTAVGFANVCARYLTHYSLAATEELLTYGFLLLTVFLLAMSAWFSWQALVNLYGNGMKSYALQIPAWYYQAGVPFGFALIIVRYLQYAAQVLRDPDHAPHEVPDV